MSGTTDLELEPGVMIDKLPYPIDSTLQIQGLAKDDEGKTLCFVVDIYSEVRPSWWKLKDVRAWRGILKSEELL